MLCLLLKAVFVILQISSTHGALEIAQDLIFKVNETNLINILRYSLQLHECSQVYSMDSWIAQEMLKIVHNTPFTPCFLATDGTLGTTYGGKRCTFRLYIASSSLGLVELLRRSPLQKARFLMLLYDIRQDDFNHFVNEEGLKYIGDSEGVLVNFIISDVIYKYTSIQKRFRMGSIENILTNVDVDLGQRYENFRGKKVRAATFNCSINSRIGPLDEKGKPSWIGGVEMKFFDELSTKLNFTYELVIPGSDDQVGFTDDAGNWTGGVMSLIDRQEADVAFCGLWFTSFTRLSSISTSSPVTDICLTFLVPRPKLFSQMGLGLFRSLGWEVWAFLFAETLAVAWFLQGLAYLTSRFSSWSQQMKDFMKFDKSVMILLAILFSNAPKSVSILGPVRHVMAWWAVTALVISTSMSSSLISHLTKALYGRTISTFEQLIDEDFRWCSETFPNFGQIFNLDDKWEKKWVKRYKTCDAEKQCKQIKYKDSHYAVFIMTYIEGVHLLHPLPCKESLRKYEVMPHCVSRLYTGFLFQENSNLRDIFSDYITRYQESGMFIKEYKEELHLLALKEPYVYESRIPIAKQRILRIKLQLSNILATWYLFALGVAFSGSAFIGELVWYHRVKLFRPCGCFKAVLDKTILDKEVIRKISYLPALAKRGVRSRGATPSPPTSSPPPPDEERGKED